jgi:hypothetical protein
MKTPIRSGFKTPSQAQSLRWTETSNSRNILDMDACPDSFICINILSSFYVDLNA